MSNKEDSTLVALTVADYKTAHDLLKKMVELDKKDDYVKIVDAATAVRTKRGRVKIKQTKDIGGLKGGVGGGAIGILAGAAIAGPVGAAIGGAAGGVLAGVYARARDKGIDDKFMRKIGHEIDKGQAALFVLYTGNWEHSLAGVEQIVKDHNAALLYSSVPLALMEDAQDAAEAVGGDEVASDYEVDTTPEEEAAPEEAAEADDLTKLAGIGPKTASVLVAAGIDTFAKLADTSEPTLRDTLHAGGVAVPKSVSTWPMQASFAAKGDWPGLNAYNQHSKDEAEKAAPEEKKEEVTPDDFSQIEGIGPKSEKALQAAGIMTYEQLAGTSEPDLRKAVPRAPSNIHTWPMQASFAAQGDWKGLAKYNQDRKAKSETSGDSKPAAKEVEPDDLTKLDGIGPRTASVLAGAGITTYAQLAQSNEGELAQILSAAGMLTPGSMSSWPRQASYAAQGDWKALADYNQKRKA